jgi:hypothetical protein
MFQNIVLVIVFAATSFSCGTKSNSKKEEKGTKTWTLIEVTPIDQAEPNMPARILAGLKCDYFPVTKAEFASEAECKVAQEVNAAEIKNQLLCTAPGQSIDAANVLKCGSSAEKQGQNEPR